MFLLLPSPTFIRSAYCVEQECRIFAESIEARRERFAAPFANDLFAVRCPILPVDRNEHWTLFPGLTDIPFHDETATFDFESAEFEKSFGQLVGELVDLLKRMRNHSTSVFVYPPSPDPDLQDAYKLLVAELSAHSYRVLPDRKVNLPDQLREASLSVFLIGERYDENAGALVDIAAQLDKPWVAWCSPAVENADADQIGFSANLEQLESRTKMYLNPGVSPSKLKEEVMALLKPAPRGVPAAEGKPSVYLVYNARDVAERKNAGLISYNFRKDFHFEHPDDPAQHTQRLTQSEAVLLVWGHAEEEWCSREFLEIVQTARRGDSRGLCVFDPKDAKVDAVERDPANVRRAGLHRRAVRAVRSGPPRDLLHIRSAAVPPGTNREFRRGRSATADSREPLPRAASVRDHRVSPVLRPRPAGRRAGEAPRAQSISRRRGRVRQWQVVTDPAPA